MMIAELDEVQYDLELDGELVRRQLARQVWEQRGWATVAVAFQDRDKAGAWKPTKLALVRFRREHDAWKRQSTVTLDGPDALALASTITGWREHLGS